jgi:5,10-methenyltetrahydrofolate synthetase
MMMPFEDNTAWRRAMRREMVDRRAALTIDQHAMLSSRIVAHVLGNFSLPRVSAFCWPIKHEPDVRGVASEWCKAGGQATLPVVINENLPLAFRAWTATARLVPDRYGIPTPVEGAWLQPDLILLPLNGFDAAGYRLGYGGGYFDRTLAACTPRPQVVGIGFEINRLATIRPEAHDQRLDWIVTENGVFKPVDRTT